MCTDVSLFCLLSLLCLHREMLPVIYAKHLYISVLYWWLHIGRPTVSASAPGPC